jgi:hypothetical protein
MEYLKVRWIHSHDNEPVLLYSELDEHRREVRKIEVFADGRMGFASLAEATPSTKTRLSIEPLPTFEDIKSDVQFEPLVITKDEFDSIWSRKRQE